MKSIRNKLVSLAFLFVPLISSFVAVANGASLDVFLKLEGIQGDSTDPMHTNEIVAVSFKIAVQQTAGGGGGTGHPQFTPLTVFKFIDRASPELFFSSATGRHLRSATLVVRKSGTNPFEFYKIRLKDVVISNLSQDANATDQDGNLIESIALSYSVISWTFIPQNVDGSPGVPITFTYNVAGGNQAF